MTNWQEISKTFNKQAPHYEQAAKVQLEIGQRLFDRLDYLNIAPQRILDLGCGTGRFSLQLQKRYPKAHIVAIDFAFNMLLQSRSKQGLLRKWSLSQGQVEQLPFASGIFDLVFANQVLHWAYPLAPVFRELNRVMNANACLMFSTLGPDSLQELKRAWNGVDTFAHTHDFVDMHDVGDVLLAEHFLEPVVDMERLAVHYQSLNHLLASLKNQGVRNINPQRNHGLTGKHAWRQFEKNYQQLTTEKGAYPLSYEVVYGHAWKGSNRKTDKGTETFIPITSIKGLTS